MGKASDICAHLTRGPPPDIILILVSEDKTGFKVTNSQYCNRIRVMPLNQLGDYIDENQSGKKI